ncbi:VOC family protein [Adhaeribacter arboris]|uniref:VOC family protein n=1 Tax=Adhaeribacter arboris TaxID=2072846 RepID=A0A2T2YDB6_9BACT|nr:VOC family protein [Adhaeribacter arboris]PSR53448.1 VOC family protein [Adhaeribacter arboris]
MAGIHPYLNFNGNTEEAFNFYKSVFGGAFLGIQRYKDTPEANKISAADQDKIMHVALPVKGTILMATDALESMGHTLTMGNNIHLSLDTDSEEEADQLFNGLAAGGQVKMPLNKTFWGAYFGMVTDKFGVHWMVSYDEKQSA